MPPQGIAMIASMATVLAVGLATIFRKRKQYRAGQGANPANSPESRSKSGTRTVFRRS